MAHLNFIKHTNANDLVGSAGRTSVAGFNPASGNLFCLLLILAFVVGSCQREYSLENAQVARGSLQATLTGDCLPKTVSGIYKAGLRTTTGNTAEVTVNVTAPGSYLVSTNTSNGYSFTGAGTFTTTGATVVVLQCRGTPDAAGTDSFTVRFDSSVCSLPVTVVSSATPPAVYTLVSGGTPPNCASAVVNGSYTLGTATDNSNYTAVAVNVTAAGTYTLTAAGGGLTFSGSGVFTTTGVQTVLLRAAGVPTVQGANAITFAAMFAGCSFPVLVSGPAVYTINCANAQVIGDYIDRTPLNFSNTIELPVVVTVAGTYRLSATVRGMTFSASGTLATGLQTITLNGSGTPGNWGTAELPIGGCLIPIPVQATLGSRQWRFTVGGVLYQGPINSTTFFVSGNGSAFSTFGTSQLPVTGYNFSMVLAKYIPSGIYTPANYLGTYMSGWPSTQGRATFKLTISPTTGFQADTAHGNLTVIWLLQTEGTFSGTVTDSTGADRVLTDGYFRTSY